MDAKTIRERLLEVAGKFARIEFAVFTTFNFNADFFEQNVLPTLFGEEIREGSRKAREQSVHKGLAATRVGVFYDPSVASTSAKAYGYTAYPVFLGGQRRFHPKCIFIAGTDSQGTLWLYVAAMSANLSLSGWGRNCEGFFDTWVHARTEQPARAAVDFFRYLDAKLDDRPAKDGLLKDLVARLGLLHDRRCKDDPEGGAWSAKGATKLYFSPLHSSLWSFVEQAYEGEPDEVRVASPYWGDGTQIKKTLADTRLRLVASRRAPDFSSTLLGADTLNQLGVDPRDVLTWSNNQEDKGRFFHIKLYCLIVDGKEVTGTGSCNFTSPGLQWGEPGSETGNVECMLFDRLGFPWPRTEKLKPGAIPAETDNTDTPQPWPVYVHVLYDWALHRFAWEVEGRTATDLVELELPDGQGRFHPKDKGVRDGELKSRDFRFHWKGETYTGLVAEVNLAHSDRRYGTLLSPGQILDSWHNGAFSEPPLPDDEDSGAPQPEKGPAGFDAKLPVDAAKPFDWFVFFRSLSQRRERVAQTEDPRELLELLVTRTDSVAMMAAAVIADSMPPTNQWIVVDACSTLLKPHHHVPEVRAQLRTINRHLAKLRLKVQASLGDIVRERRLRSDSAKLLAWYELRLRSS